MTQSREFLPHLERESARFLEVLRDAAPDTPVPTCPDWNAEDLLWHLAEVQWFWGQIVTQQITDGAIANALELGRPDGHVRVTELFESVAAELLTALTLNPPEKPVWTWADEQTVRFIRRRQAHEALIHRVDAEVALGTRTPMDRRLCEDGIDEVLRVMYGGLPAWGNFAPDAGQTVRVELTDSSASWFVTMGTFTGTDPDDGKSYDEPDIGIGGSDPGAETAATVQGRAADINCWLWHRPGEEPVRQSGNQEILDRLNATMAPGIN